MKKLWVCIVVGLLAAPLFGSTSKVVENLQTAFNGESNAHARYLEFAGKADQEGFGSVASLFRAAARAEQIHADNHALVIRKLGGSPQATIEKVVVKSTGENLQVAIQGETYERDVMYPQFIKEARAERNTDAIQTFNYAKSAETEHARLYTEAHSNLPQLKGQGVSYYVCTVCGFTTTKMNFDKCPSCFNPKEAYVAVS